MLGGAPRAPLAPTFALTAYVPGATPVKTYLPSAPGWVEAPRRPAPASISVWPPAGTRATDRNCGSTPSGVLTVTEMVAVGTS